MHITPGFFSPLATETLLSMQDVMGEPGNDADRAMLAEIEDELARRDEEFWSQWAVEETAVQP